MTTSPDPAPLDRRLNAVRDDLAAEELRGRVQAAKFVEPRAQQVGVATLAVRERPDPAAPLATEGVFGERLGVFDVANGWAWIQLNRDRYVGYAPVEGLSIELIEPTHRVAALATFVYPDPDIKAPPLMQLPLGAELRLVDANEQFGHLQTGGFVAARHLREWGRPEPDFVDVAERFIGTPYLWGGRTRHGIDCSGLIQVALQAAGISSPRDTDMQESSLGDRVLVPDNLENLQRGDLVFWSGHVGVMVDSVMLLHANAHHMSVAVEPLVGAARRIATTGTSIRTVKRLARLSAAR